MNRTQARHERAKELFSQAIALSEEERRPFLDRACGDDLDLLHDVECLIKYDSPDDSFGLFVPESTLCDAPSALRYLSRYKGKIVVIAIVAVATSILWLHLRSTIRHRIATRLQELCAIQVRAIREWELARIRETEQLGNDPTVRSIAKKLVRASRFDVSERENSEAIEEFYWATSAYTLAHDGAAINLVSRDGLVLADANPEFVGRRLNARAFGYVIPVFQGNTRVTPLVQNGSMVVEPPEGISRSTSHSFALSPIRDDSEVIAVLASMEPYGNGYRAIASAISKTSDVCVTLFDNNAQIVHCSASEPSDARESNPNHGLFPRILGSQRDTSIQSRQSQTVLDPYVNHRGHSVVGAWEWIPDSQTGVMVEIDSFYAYWPLRSLSKAIAAILFLVGGVLFWEPIRNTVRGVNEVDNALVDNRYRMQQLLGEGGMSKVFRARDLVLERDVAIKTQKIAILGTNAISRFQREIRMLSSFVHPTTIRVFDTGLLPSGEPYYVMEYVDGMTLDQIVNEHGKRDERKTISWMISLCSSIGEAHAAGVIHRDIKPQNIMVSNFRTSEEFIKVLDFGLGKSFLDDVDQITSTTEVPGTLQFMAPEVFETPNELGPSADVFSMGGLMFYLLCGTAPYSGESSLKVIHSIVNSCPDFSCLAAAGVSDSTQALVKACLSHRACDRPADGWSLKKMLLAIEARAV